MVYMLLAQGFEEIEAVYPIDVLRRCGVEVKTVGVCGEYVTGSNAITIKTDIQLDEIGENIKMLILPGGPGRVNIIKNKQAMELIKHCRTADVPIAAICGAPEILAQLGLLDGKKFTCYPGLEENLTGGVYVNQPVVIDGNLITSQAAGTSQAFAFAIAQFLCGKEKSDEICGKMLCR
jgi:4-methyl-5(b-hydroxyethyl)-thiazole monophosphate biosynthesis